ncbi:MAG: Na+/H+ antiporter NhaA [Polyangiaceae bacterium]
MSSAVNSREAAPPPLPRLLFAVVRPFQRFLETESSSGIVLLAVTVFALLWANSPWHETYEALLHVHLSLGFGERSVSWPLHHWINDGLMTVFFLVAGMEIKRELVVGELRSLRRAALPLIAATGGMIVPAVIFASLNASSASLRGWGIPMATDIAFALGGITLLGRRVPSSLYVFLAALAIFDDLGAIIVIALFYGSQTNFSALALAALITGVLVLFARLRVQAIWPYILVGLALWVALLFSGIHATLAGVILGLCIPARAPRSTSDILADLDRGLAVLRQLLQRHEHHDAHEQEEGAIAAIERHLESVQPPLDRLQHGLHSVVALGILPLFALANAGVSLHLDTSHSEALHSALGVALGLLLGKPIGVLGATFLAIRAGFAPLPTGARWSQLIGVGLLAGIGFTMSIFIASLAFPGDPALQESAKIGILAASSICLVSGVLWLWKVCDPLPSQTVDTPLPVYVDRIEFADEFRVEPWRAHGDVCGKTLAESDLRRRTGVHVVGAWSSSDTSRKLRATGGDFTPSEGDTLLLVGERSVLERFLVEHQRNAIEPVQQND